ncbi:MAG TPA: hypothetical protein ENO18_06285 [Caldithrix sp.]|nr:hypothetical protein [Caldithrix sp.]
MKRKIIVTEKVMLLYSAFSLKLKSRGATNTTVRITVTKAKIRVMVKYKPVRFLRLYLIRFFNVMMIGVKSSIAAKVAMLE